MAAANMASAQAQSVTTTTSSAGTISEFGPQTIIIKSETSPDPMRYTYTKTTTYVDEAGAPVTMSTVKSGLPVTVYYVKDGDNMVASKVVVRKAAVVTPVTTVVPVTPVTPVTPIVEEKKTTTTTTTP